MITSASTGVDTKSWDFVTHYIDTQAWLPRNVVFVNKAAFDTLHRRPEEGGDGRSQGRRGARLEPSSEAKHRPRTRSLRDNKIAILPPSDALKTGFTAIGKQIADEWVTAAGADGKAILDAYAK